MKKHWLMIPALAALMLAVATAVSQPPGGRDKGAGKKGGPPGGGFPGGGPPPYELGKVLPPFVREGIELTRDQEEELAKLEREVKERLEKILTSKQKDRIKTLRPPGPGGPGGPDGPPPGAPGDFRPPDAGGNRGQADRPDRPKENADEKPTASKSRGGIQWYATWESGLREAQRTGRPILLVSAAPHCAGVSGIW